MPHSLTALFAYKLLVTFLLAVHLLFAMAWLPRRRKGKLKKHFPSFTALEAVKDTFVDQERTDLIAPALELFTLRKVYACKHCVDILDSLVDALLQMSDRPTSEVRLVQLSICQEVVHVLAQGHQRKQILIVSSIRCTLQDDDRKRLAEKLSQLSTLGISDNPLITSTPPSVASSTGTNPTSSSRKTRTIDRWVNVAGIASSGIAVILEAIPLASAFAGIPRAISIAVKRRQIYNSIHDESMKILDHCDRLSSVIEDMSPDLQSALEASKADARDIATQNRVERFIYVSDDLQRLTAAAETINQYVSFETLTQINKQTKDQKLLLQDIVDRQKLTLSVVFL